MTTQSELRQPLEGITVLEMTRTGPAAFCTMMLGDMGADIIKVQTPRESGFASTKENDKKLALNRADRNKRGIGLNLKSADGRAIFHQLAKKSDVFVEGFRPGVLTKLDADYQTLKKLNPHLVYCSLSGYGQDGPYRDLPGHDINYIATAGVLDLIGEADRPPVIPLNLIADYASASLHAVIGILLALRSRDNTKQGQYVDISYMDGTLSLLGCNAIVREFFASDYICQRGGTALAGTYPYYRTYQTSDGKRIAIGCIEPWFWERLCKLFHREDLIRYSFHWRHMSHPPEDEAWNEIRNYLEQMFLTKSSEEWLRLLIKEDIPVAKVNNLADAFSDPQVMHRGMIVELESKAGKVKQVGIPIKLSDTPGSIRRLAPALGEHTDEILCNLGYPATDIKRFRQENAVA